MGDLTADTPWWQNLGSGDPGTGLLGTGLFGSNTTPAPNTQIPPVGGTVSPGGQTSYEELLKMNLDPVTMGGIVKHYFPNNFYQWLNTNQGMQYVQQSGQAVGNGTVKLPDGTFISQDANGAYTQVAPGVGQNTLNQNSGIPPSWQDPGPMPSTPLPSGYIWQPNYSSGKWEMTVGSLPGSAADQNAMTDYQKAEAANAQAQLAESQRQFDIQQQQTAQTAAQTRQSYLANMLTQPQSFIQFALETGKPPVVQPWMVPLMGSQYGQPKVGDTIPGWNGQQWQNPNNNLNGSGTAPTTGTTTPVTPAPTINSVPTPYNGGATPLPYTGGSTGATPMLYTPGTSHGPTPMVNNLGSTTPNPMSNTTVPTAPAGSAPNLYGQTPQTADQMAAYYAQFNPAQAAANPQGTAAQTYNYQTWTYTPEEQQAIADHLKQSYIDAGITGPNQNVGSGGTIPDDQYNQMMSQAIQSQNAWEAAMKNSGQFGNMVYGSMAPGVNNTTGSQTYGSSTPLAPPLPGGYSGVYNRDGTPAMSLPGYGVNGVWGASVPTSPGAAVTPTAQSYSPQVQPSGGYVPSPTTPPAANENVMSPYSQASSWMTPMPNATSPVAQTTGTTPMPTTGLGLPTTTTPSQQYWARMGPTAQQQYLGYQTAATGAPSDETLWRMGQTTAPSGSSVYNGTQLQYK